MIRYINFILYIWLYILLYTGGRNDFIKNVDLIFKLRTIIEDYYRQINANNFEKWMNEKLIPNCPLQSIIIINNASFYSI